MTRSPTGRCNFEDAATEHLIPAPLMLRANTKPVGPDSYVAATGPGKSFSHATISP